MNGRARIATLSLLLLLVGAPCAFADAAPDPETETDASPEPEAETDAEPQETEAEVSHGGRAPEMSPEARLVRGPVGDEAFGPDPTYDQPYDADAQLAIYRTAVITKDGKTIEAGKHLLKTAQPPVQVGRRMYDRGRYETRATWFGKKNPNASHFMAYGDLRTAYAYYDNGVVGDNGETDQSTLALRLNLDMDLKFTATERIHAFVRPTDMGGSTMRYDFDGKVEDVFTDELDFNFETLFFEGDLGALATGWSDKSKKYDLPIALGLVPLLTQNGIWLNDTFYGFAFAFTAKSSAKNNIPNMDFTFFAGFDKVTSGAVDGDHDASLYGMAGFMDVGAGYMEYGYGYIDAEVSDLSYHNATIAFTKRYGHRLSNSVRLIGNFGQDTVQGAETADGFLLLVENSLITGKPSTLIPYFNLFAGWDTPQALARDSGTGGVLNNTGINFETDGMTGFPTLDSDAHESYGGAVGVEYLFALNRQLIVEAAAVERMSDSTEGSEYALGVRFQEPLSNAWILRFDAMAGWRDGREDVFGTRLEIRRKF